MTVPAAAGRTVGIALALGGGGARGLAHLKVLEAFDELGVRPVAIAGTSIGALIGAPYAAGIPARDIAAHLAGLLRNRGRLWSLLVQARIGRFADLWRSGNPVLVDGEKLFGSMMPEGLPATFEELAIPLMVVTTEWTTGGEVVFRSGPLLPAVAGSAALPGLVKPIEIEGHILLDGGAVNPLPFDLLFGHGWKVVAVDVTSEPKTRDVPDPWTAAFGSLYLLQTTLVQHKLRLGAPDVVLRPNVGVFRVLDFQRVTAILRASEPIKEETKRTLDKLLAVE